MMNYDFLPVPDWGLECRECGASLTGATVHRCQRCGSSFNPRDLLAMVRPVPALDVRCSRCGYELEGLAGGVCPECGDRFNLHQLLHSRNVHRTLAYTPEPYRIDAPPTQHRPRFDGTERPLPNFGLRCLSCRYPLAGAPGDDCVRCGRRYSIAAYMDPVEQTDIGPWIPPTQFDGAEQVLRSCGISSMVQSIAWRECPGLGLTAVWIQLLVNREWALDALYELSLEPRPSAPPSDPWTCQTCGEHVPAYFGVRWNCQNEFEREKA